MKDTHHSLLPTHYISEISTNSPETKLFIKEYSIMFHFMEMQGYIKHAKLKWKTIANPEEEQIK